MFSRSRGREFRSRLSSSDRFACVGVGEQVAVDHVGQLPFERTAGFAGGLVSLARLPV
jgi:hypothetical protein